MQNDLIAAMVECLRVTDPWRGWKGNASFERQCEALLPVVREAVEREIVAWLHRPDCDSDEGRAWVYAEAIERGDYRAG
jgi:hypothetical protein